MDSEVNNEFPVDWEEDHYFSRREFFKFVTLASGGLAMGSVALAAWTKLPKGTIEFEPAPIAKVNDLAPGKALAFSYPRPSDLCILVQKPDGEFVAYSRRCTHLSCPVDYQVENNRLYCPCHNGAFSIDDGHVLQGPPPHPLPKVVVEVRGDEIWATGVKHTEEGSGEAH
ncbi:MAG: Rieske 2Fe-2S domain-containing protein [Fimbriimonadaceae bacterium]|nr:Rieske 2Fe-2S domain-containing protein [Fimbriimonadaceae bacterium]